jgi:hypothetical protein
MNKTKYYRREIQKERCTNSVFTVANFSVWFTHVKESNRGHRVNCMNGRFAACIGKNTFRHWKELIFRDTMLFTFAAHLRIEVIWMYKRCISKKTDKLGIIVQENELESLD